MSFSNYASLQSEIANWLDLSTDSITTVDVVTLAEAAIKSRLRISEMVLRESATVSTTSRYLQLPNYFVEMISLHIDGSPLRPLQQISTEQINSFSMTGSDKPRFFTVVGNELEFDCIPNSEYTVEMKLYAFQPLSGTNTTNAILTTFPDLYFAECRRIAAIYVKDDAEIASATNELYGVGGIYQRIEDRERMRNYSRQPLTTRVRGATP